MVRYRLNEERIVQLGGELAGARTAEGRGFHADGPPQVYETEDELYRHLVDLWRNSSLQLHHLCRSNGARYLHVVQPNQYHAGSKPMGPEERREAFFEDQEYGLAIARGYPLLLDEGESLRRAGVRSHDLTGLFAEVHERIYIDPFCHYNQRGNEMLADAVAGLIVEATKGGD